MKNADKSISLLLASFATLKSLSDEKIYQNPYQILKEFIRYVIISDSLYGFTATEMKNRFGFDIPEVVIRTSIKSMDNVSLSNGVYSISKEEMTNDSIFEEKKREAIEYEKYIMNLLIEYISKETRNDIVDKRQLIQDLLFFVTDDSVQVSDRYIDLIGKFLLKHEQDKKIQDGLRKIREGSILYIGLTSNICDTGSIKKVLVLYVGTEILFSLCGYNGEIFLQFANDFYEQVKNANLGKSKKIELRYFAVIKKEIEDFFNIASDIVEGKKMLSPDKPAMKMITDGCKTSADVMIKKADFYYKLNQLGIKEDSQDNYYKRQFFSTNLECNEYDEDENDNKKKEIALKLISHINKLRKGQSFPTDLEAEHLIVTNSRVILSISNDQVNKIKEEKQMNYICNFAVSLNKITNLLWYKLGNGFSKNLFPSSVNVALKARVVLSSSIAKKVEREFSNSSQQYREGNLTKEQLLCRILVLREKNYLPEDLNGEEIDDVMDFSFDCLNRFEEQVKKTQAELREKNEFIENLKTYNKKKVEEKETTIYSQQKLIKEKDDENIKLKSELKELKRREIELKEKKELISNRWKFAFNCIIMIACLVLINWVVVLCQNKFGVTIPPYIYTIVDVVGLILVIWRNIKQMINKYPITKRRLKQTQEKTLQS